MGESWGKGMWRIRDQRGRELLLPRECMMEGDVLRFRDWTLPIIGDLQALDPSVMEVLRESIPGATWVGEE